MSQAATLTRNNQITVPKNVRELLGVKAGQRVVFSATKGAVILKKERTAEEVAGEIQRLITDEMRANWQRNAGKTAGEIREEWLRSPAGKKYYARRGDE